jgi:hypothetical protein
MQLHLEGAPASRRDDMLLRLADVDKVLRIHILASKLISVGYAFN